MSRLTWGLVVASSLYAAHARAGQAEIAAQLNEDGKNLMFQKNYAEASAKFADAVARVPEARYFFNLCMSRYQEGKFGEALTACNSVEKNGADDALKTKAQKLTEKIKDEAKKQGLDLQPAGGGAAPGDTPPVTGGGDAGGPPPPTGDGAPPPTGGGAPSAGAATMAVGRPPEQSLYQGGPPEHTYTWTLGIDLFAGGGKIGGTDATGADIYGHAAGGFRLKSDVLLNPAAKIGGEGYIQVTHLDANKMQAAAGDLVDTLDIVDLGVAGYKHFCQGGGRMCLTPLVGVQLALLAPGSQQYDSSSEVANYASLGLRAELDGSLAFGPRFEHVLSAQVGLNAYSAAFASPSDPAVGLPANQIGLDKGGAFAYVGFGYTYRFNTPLGQRAFVTLE